MKEVQIAKGLQATIKDVPIPEPGPDQLVIKVIVSGSNPKDWKIPEWIPDYNANSGDDIAGIVHSVGSNVWEFKPGDRVASFHEMMTPGGSFAEYALGWQHTTVHIPHNISFEQASTIPLAALTAAIGLHQRLGLPDPWTPAKEPLPLVVYGGAAAVGAYTIQLARLANIHPIIAVAGRASSFVEGLIDRSKGDTIVDYRNGDEAVVSGIRDALKGAKLHYAFDATSEHNSYINICKVLEKDGHLTLVLPGKQYEGIPETVHKTETQVGEAHKGDSDYAYVVFRYMAKGLAEGWFKPHPHEVVPGGLEGVETGLRNLKEGKASGLKYVFKIGQE
ncbi:zinc-binding oxidoreductase-like protein ToxD [Plenodomus tracheiphilus IPT5]|uniref:Zinc-binding oxidoreductase-like protein ToxD n=1 Tax=Plenodomus tracheiphilus IPT5 TaxID=1408161 RepID=A0A6A7BE72_9PLEO|nr:zinc-binding oxidoreductase-like protein ToxD [Plenodomus tracheiphilus IPT5]